MQTVPLRSALLNKYCLGVFCSCYRHHGTIFMIEWWMYQSESLPRYIHLSHCASGKLQNGLDRAALPRLMWSCEFFSLSIFRAQGNHLVQHPGFPSILNLQRNCCLYIIMGQHPIFTPKSIKQEALKKTRPFVWVVEITFVCVHKRDDTHNDKNGVFISSHCSGLRGGGGFWLLCSRCEWSLDSCQLLFWMCVSPIGWVKLTFTFRVSCQ